MALIKDPNYKKLEEWYKANAGSLNMRDMFAADQDRFIKFRSGQRSFFYIRVRAAMRWGGDGRWA